MNTYILSKGRHNIEVQEMGDVARILGLRGWIDSIDLMALLVNNGYTITK